MRDAFLDADAIRAGTFIRHVEIHETLGSTNDRAAELARDREIELPALVVARHQTAGRGRGKNTWWSADGALTFSVLLDPSALNISTQDWPQLSLAASVAVCDTLAGELNSRSGNRDLESARVAIKWPNDVVLDGGKVAGILIESPGGGPPAKDRLVIGVGINVNNSWTECRGSILGSKDRIVRPANAIALRDATRRCHSLDEVLCQILARLDTRLGELSTHAHALAESWRKMSWLTEQGVELESNGTWTLGICVGIDDDGAILVETVLGIERFLSGSVRVRCVRHIR